MIFELADGGTLRQHLEKRFDELTWQDKYQLGLGIVDGLRYLHSLDIIHKDLVVYCRLNVFPSSFVSIQYHCIYFISHANFI